MQWLLLTALARPAEVWPAGVYSVVRFELHAEGEGTRLVLDHSGVPAEGRDAVAAGWHARYWEPLRSYLG